MPLDVYTLFICELLILGFLSIIMLFAWSGSQYDRVLGFTIISLVATLLAVFLSSLRSSGLLFLPIAVGNIMVYFAYGMLINAFRVFQNKSLGLSWLAGALLWAILCLVPQFYLSLPRRVMVSCVLCMIYTVALIRLLARARATLPATFWPAQLLLIFHLLFNTARLLFDDGLPSAVQGAIGGTHFSVWVILESILFVIGLTFTILAMVNERTRLMYQHASLIDPLTGVANRRALFIRASQLAAWCTRYQQPLTVVLFDLDHFKSINDRFGHHQGDQILLDFCQRVNRQLPQTNAHFARLGGEEFAVVLSMNEQDGWNWCEKVRKSVQASAPQNMVYTTSTGMASVEPCEQNNIDSLMVAADEALYRAKASGRNRVEVFAPLVREPQRADQ